MRTIFGRLLATLLALFLTSGLAAAQTKVTVAVGGGSCLCYLPTVLAKQLGEYEQAGLAVELVDLKVGVSAPGSSTDFFLKYLLKKNGLDPTSAAVIGVGLGATAVAAMQQGQIDAAVMLDPSVTVLQGSAIPEGPESANKYFPCEQVGEAFAPQPLN